MLQTSRSLFFLLLLLLVACSPPAETPFPTPGQELVETMVASTLTAGAPPASTPLTPSPSPASPSETPAPSASPTLAPTPTRSLGTVSGKVCYRTREIPAMTAYFQETETEAVIEQPIVAGQITYTVSLPPGRYIAYAWLPDFSVGGLYSNAIACGLKESCRDRSPVPFSVTAGEAVQGVDLCDWYAFSVPEPPGKDDQEIRGAISGRVAYPGGSSPVLHVVAFSRTTGYWYYVVTLDGNPSFTINDLPPGEYTLVSYTRSGEAGGYTGEGGTLQAVTVQAGETTSGVLIDNWSAGSFPADPTEW